MAVTAEVGTMPDLSFTDVDMNEQRVMASLEVLAQFGFTDNMSYAREILRRDTFSVTMPKLNCLVSSEYDLHAILNKHMVVRAKSPRTQSGVLDNTRRVLVIEETPQTHPHTIRPTTPASLRRFQHDRA